MAVGRKYVQGMVWLGMMALAGCRTVPFEPVKRVPLADQSAESIRRGFSRQVPAIVEEENTVTFEFAWRKVAALGVLRIDRTRGRFAVVGLTHAGVKLFEITGDGDAIQTHFLLPELARRGDLGRAIGSDIRSIYLDLVPAPSAEVDRTRDSICFHESWDNGEGADYVLAGAPAVLVEKRCFSGGHKVATVRYYDYVESGGKLSPTGVILDNHKASYRLIIRRKTGS